MTIQLNFDKLISFGLFASLALIIMLMVTPAAQAGISLHFGYSPYGGHHAYGYSPYGEHRGYGHYRNGYRYPRHYGQSSYYYGNRHAYGYRYPYITPEFTYRDRSYDRGGSTINNSYQGWSLLRNNQAREALDDFSRQAQATPSKGDPKVGYALASADLGKLDDATWAMRRALKIDPGSLHYIVLDQRLDAKLKHIIRQYDKQLTYSPKDTDAAFMLASLHYLRRDMDTARSMINQADISTSTRNLRDLINKEK